MSRLLSPRESPATTHVVAGDPVASIRDLHVTFSRGGRDVSAVRGVSLDIAPGEIVGLVGESGSGKSVLGMSILGLHPDSPPPVMSGSVVVDGIDMVTAGVDERRDVRRKHLGAVFQDPMTSLDPTMTVGRQVTEAARGDKDEALSLLDAVGIPDPRRRFDSYPHQLSGGLRQRVMIAMAVAGDPSLVVADEPTTALDVSVQAQILALLRSLCDDRGTSLLFVTHDLGVASQLADRIMVMYGGRVAESGPALGVLEHPVHPYTSALLLSRLTMHSDRNRPLVTLPGEPPDPREHPVGCAFAPRCGFADDRCHAEIPTLESSVIDVGLVAVAGHDGEVACFNAGSTVGGDLAPSDPWGPVSNTLAGYGSPKHRPVELVGVTKQFEVREGLRKKRMLHALRGVDLSVEVGESVALVGESGSGKSTLLRVVAGLLEPDHGTVVLGEGGGPQIVFQDAGASMTPWLTIGALLGERLLDHSRASRRERGAESLNVVGLPAEVAKVKPRQLSGGQRQRAALARAVVVPPSLLLCDEPTSALDVSLAATVLNLIGRLRRELGMAVMFVTHDLAAARLVSDRIAVMYLGRIVECGPSDDVVQSPRHPYTRALLAAVPEAGAVHVPLPGDPPSAIDPPTGCAFHPRCPHATEICTTQDPAMAASSGAGSGHVVACHHEEEL